MGVMRIACCLFVAILCSLVGAASASADDVLVLGKDGKAPSREDRGAPRRYDEGAAAARRGAGDHGAPRRRSAGPPTASSSGCATTGRSRPRNTPPAAPGSSRSSAAPSASTASARARCGPSSRRSRTWRRAGSSPPRASCRCGSRSSATSSGGAPGARSARRSGSSSRAPSSSGSTTRARGCSSRCSATSASSTASGAAARTPGSSSCSTSCCRSPPIAPAGVAWEYYFSFGGGSPPWVSGLAEGTAVQALSRAAKRLHREADVLPIAKRALGDLPQAHADRRPRAGRGTATTTRSTRSRPSLRVLNGFIQSLIGLYDYARLSKDPEGTELFQAAEPEARREIPLYDTGAWSLYSRGSSTHESSSPTTTCCEGFLAEPLQAHQDRRSTARPPTTSSPTRRVPPELEVQDRPPARRPLRPRAVRALEDLDRDAADHPRRPHRRGAAVRRRRLREAHVRLAGAAQARAPTR